MDILLTNGGDIALDEKGDLQLADSVRQKIQIRLRWFAGEWRWDPDQGVDYYGKVLVKNPDETIIKREIRNALSDIDEITSLTVTPSWDSRTRTGSILVIAKTDSETIKEEVSINGRIRGDG